MVVTERLESGPTRSGTESCNNAKQIEKYNILDFSAWEDESTGPNKDRGRYDSGTSMQSGPLYTGLLSRVWRYRGTS